MITYFAPLLIPVGLVLLFRTLNKRNRPPIFGVYQQRTKYFWLKFLFMYTVLRFRQLIAHLKRLHAVDVGKSCDGTVHVPAHDAEMEKKHDIEDQPQGIDAVYFNGTKEDDAIICGLARRAKNIVDSFFYLKVNGEELLLSPRMPIAHQQQDETEGGQYKINGLEIVNFIPMRTWKVYYNGDMKTRSNPDKPVKVQMELTWSANFAPFNYDGQISPVSMARDIATEKWSRDYFELLKKFHQTHYEQMGYIKGNVTVDGRQRQINVPCVRDHSFGPFRDWNTFHRYVLNFLFLENGDCMEIGTVCQPAVLSHLTIGYLCRKSDQAILPVDSCDFLLYQHGENGTMPKDYGFSFTAGKETYTVRVQVTDEDHIYIGKAQEGRIHERWCTAEVNGVKGWGCLEWHYNNVQK